MTGVRKGCSVRMSVRVGQTVTAEEAMWDLPGTIWEASSGVRSFYRVAGLSPVRLWISGVLLIALAFPTTNQDCNISQSLDN